MQSHYLLFKTDAYRNVDNIHEFLSLSGMLIFSFSPLHIPKAVSGF